MGRDEELGSKFIEILTSISDLQLEMSSRLLAIQY